MRRRSGKDLDMCGEVGAAVWSERVEARLMLIGGFSV